MNIKTIDLPLVEVLEETETELSLDDLWLLNELGDLDVPVLDEAA